MKNLEICTSLILSTLILISLFLIGIIWLFNKKFWDKYKLLIIFGSIVWVIFLIGLGSEFFKVESNLWKLAGIVDTATAIALAVLAVFAYKEYAAGEDEIKIYLDVDGEKKDTQLRLLRKDVNRSEVLGLLGMIQNSNERRFNNSKFRNKEILLEFLKNIMEVQKGNRDEIVVPISKEDFEKYFSDYFDVKVKKPTPEVKILLNVEGETKDTQLTLLRKDVSRSEVLGLLGMIQNKNSGRFENSKFRDKKVLLEFLKNIKDAQRGEVDEIVVPISKEDFEKYFSEYFNKS